MQIGSIAETEFHHVLRIKERGYDPTRISGDHRDATHLASVFAGAGVRMSLATTLAALRGDDVSAPVAEARSAIEEMMAAS